MVMMAVPVTMAVIMTVGMPFLQLLLQSLEQSMAERIVPVKTATFLTNTSSVFFIFGLF